jgi:hypothetical protein
LLSTSRARERQCGYIARESFDSPLDAEIAPAVLALQSAGVETFESLGAARFHGDVGEGFRALGAALQAGLRVASLRRVWPVSNGEPTGPWWELTFVDSPGA